MNFTIAKSSWLPLTSYFSFVAKINAMDMVTVYETIVIVKLSKATLGIKSRGGSSGRGILKTMIETYIRWKTIWAEYKMNPLPCRYVSD